VNKKPPASQKTVAMIFPAKAWVLNFFSHINLCDDIACTDACFWVYNDTPMFRQLSQCCEEIPHLLSHSVTKVAGKFQLTKPSSLPSACEEPILHKTSDTEEHQ
jgi:hypothetical protein